MKNTLMKIFATMTFFVVRGAYAVTQEDLMIGANNTPTPSITDITSVFALIENTLLWGVLPVVVVGASLYMAYKLFTAEGDPAKLKEAWKTLIYAATGIIITLLAYALVKIISTLQIL